MIDRVIYLLAALVKAVKRVLRKKEQREAQDERAQIDSDSAQYAADKFGDGRVRRVNADKTNDTERPDGDSR